MSVPEVFIECPFCRQKRANYRVLNLWEINPNTHGRIPPEAKTFGLGQCYLCANKALLYFSCDSDTAPPVSALSQATRKGEGMTIQGVQFECVFSQPQPEIMDIPEGLPPEVLGVIEEADQAFKSELWRSAATGYGVAVDFTLGNILGGGDAEKLTLGKKVEKVRQRNLMTESLLDLVEGANSGRILAVHYPITVDMDTARSAREICRAVLEYTYTLPVRVSALKEQLQNAKAR